MVLLLMGGARGTHTRARQISFILSWSTSVMGKIFNPSLGSGFAVGVWGTVIVTSVRFCTARRRHCRHLTEGSRQYFWVTCWIAPHHVDQCYRTCRIQFPWFFLWIFQMSLDSSDGGGVDSFPLLNEPRRCLHQAHCCVVYFLPPWLIRWREIITISAIIALAKRDARGYHLLCKFQRGWWWRRTRFSRLWCRQVWSKHWISCTRNVGSKRPVKFYQYVEARSNDSIQIHHRPRYV